MDVIYLEEQLQEKTSFLMMNPCQGTGQCFEESLWGRKLVKNLENFIFSMDNKTAFLRCEKLCRS